MYISEQYLVAVLSVPGQGPDGEGDVVQGLQGGGCQLGSGDTPSPRVTRQ